MDHQGRPFRLFLQGKHRIDSTRGRPRAGRQHGDVIVAQNAKVWVTAGKITEEKAIELRQ